MRDKPHSVCAGKPLTHAWFPKFMRGGRHLFIGRRFNIVGFISCLLVALALSACRGGGGSAAPPVSPGGVMVTAGDGYMLLEVQPVTGAIAYNLYWSTTPGVSKASGARLPITSKPQAHTGLTNGQTYYYVATAVGAGGESLDSIQVSAIPVAAAITADPLYGDQWHLKNTGQLGATASPGTAGEDMNVEPAWVTHKGTGIRIAVVDDGLEIGHEDLASNIAATGLSYNYDTGSTDPTYDPADTTLGHGTAVAGIVAARDLNGLGVRGVAPRANLVGYNLLKFQTTSNEADAMTRGSPNVHISSNSWGPPDDGDLHSSSSAWRTAVTTGLSSGRNGLGTIYTWAAGNGGNGSGVPFDNSNYDGQANYVGVIAVAAVNDQGRQAYYSEPGANIWISAPGGEYCDTHTITTTDRSGAAGDNPGITYTDYANQNYTKCMNGTSAATPAAAGAIALILESNPNLGWRDVRLILAQTGRVNDPSDPGWFVNNNGLGYFFNHKYGFGMIDATAAVTLASTWITVGPQLTFQTAPATPNLAIPDNNSTGVSDTINVAGSGIVNIEFVEITFSAANHTYAGDLAVTLTSPAGTVSQLSESHGCENLICSTSYSGWVFGSAAHLGEPADGNWILTVKDGGPLDTGTFQSWKLQFYGR